MRWSRTCVVLLTLALPSAPAWGAELWRSGDGARSVEGAVFYKGLGSWLHMPPGLVAGTQALQSVFDEARPLLPPDAGALLPDDVTLPAQAGTGAHTARISARLLWGEELELATAWQLDFVTASHSALAGGAGPASFLGGQGATARRRLIDFDPLLTRGPGIRLQHNLDLLALKYQTSRMTLVVGRQVLSWGTGRLWNPTDLMSPFAPTDVDREVRRGVDAVRLSVPLGAVSQLDVLWLPQPELADNGGALRIQTNVRDFDVSLTAAKYVRDAVLGADFSGDLGPLGVHGEGAWTLSLERLDEGLANVSVGRHFLRAVVGVDWRPAEKWMLFAEYHFNGWGTSDAARYVETLRSDRVTRGEVFGAGRHYAGLVVAWQASDLLSVQATALANLQDPSVLVVPALEYWLEQSVLLRAGGYVPIGRPPDPAALQSLTAADLLAQTEAWSAATSSLGVRSEYGASPAGAFIQVGVYFQ